MLDPRVSAIAGAAAEAVAFVAASPVLPEGTPAIVRAGVIIAIVPVLLLAERGGYEQAPSSIFSGALIGAAYGMGASLVAGAVKGAGDLIDAGLGSPPFLSMAKAGGPLQRLYHLAYTLVLFGSGGFSAMVATLAGAHGLAQYPQVDVPRVIGLAVDSMRLCLLLAGPCLFAQALATIVTGLVARVAPSVGGILLGAQLSSASVICALALGATTLGSELLDVVRHTLALGRLIIR
ncbi:MAG: flagellar biosynthetic protein FliR [Candidatus Eremiobacteraeota bacterium]|nr:flagellar biosynthetic protein FliR [Candidatus Eremiobacteraeota bacterium]